MTDILLETVSEWFQEHRTEIANEADRRDLPLSYFVLLMLNDALGAYKNGRLAEAA